MIILTLRQGSYYIKAKITENQLLMLPPDSLVDERRAFQKRLYRPQTNTKGKNKHSATHQLSSVCSQTVSHKNL